MTLMTAAEAIRVLRALEEDEARPRYSSDAGAADLHRMNAAAIAHALVAIEDRAALVKDIKEDPIIYGQVNWTVDFAVVIAARRHMKGEP